MRRHHGGVDLAEFLSLSRDPSARSSGVRIANSAGCARNDDKFRLWPPRASLNPGLVIAIRNYISMYCYI